MKKPHRTSFIAIGQISRSVGIKGEVMLRSLTQDVTRFEQLHSVHLGQDETNTQEFEIESVRFVSSHAVVKLLGIDSRTQSDELKGRFVYIAEEDGVKPPQGSYFIHDIVGMKVVEESGKEIGTVKEVLELPANDVWVVKRQSSEVMIPAIKEVIKSVDVQGRVIVIREMEGLLE